MNVLGFLRPIRARLTLWYVLLLTVVLIVFSVALYIALLITLNEELEETLIRETALVTGALEVDAQRRLIAGLAQPPSWRNVGEEEREIFWRVLDASGRLVEQNRMYEMDARPVEPTTLEKALAGSKIFQTVRTGDDVIRLFTAPIDQSGRAIGIIQLGMSVEDVNETLGAVRWILILILPVMIVTASVGGFVLAGHALRPVDRITRTAQSITASDLSQRLDMDLPDDELGRLAHTLDAMIVRLDSAFRRQRRFTADASHELRTPLTIIKGNLSVALDSPRDAAYYQEVLTEVDEEVDEMSRLVDRMLSLARGDVEGITLHVQPVDLGVLMTDVIEQVRPMAESKGLDLEAQIPSNLTTRVDADAITQVVLNLLDNAIKFTSSGQVRLSVRRARENGGEIQVTVSDTGPGIPSEHLSHLFERFYRVDRARSRELGGVGLGLAIARELARAHGGDISVNSVPGEGSTFTVHLCLD
jgi:heavy metal sensor kinase